VRTVDLQAPGKLTIVAVQTSRVTLSGPVHWTGRHAVLVTGPAGAARTARALGGCGPWSRSTAGSYCASRLVT
jgi:hypothetical protein